MLRTRLLFGVALICLFLSGMAGLVYEIVWARYLALFLGHTSYAVVAVLVAFMGGLAVGNVWIGGRADRTRRPLAFYAWIEIGIGAYAMLFPYYYELCHAAFISLARQCPPGGAAMAPLKFAFSSLAILAPTILMGGSLPLLTRLLTHSLTEVRPSVAALYCLNSAGAVAGCLVGDFWFIPAFGLEATLYGGAAMNLAAGAAALLTSSWLKEGQQQLGREGEAAAAEPRPTDHDRSQPSSPSEEVFSAADLRLAIVGIGISGFVAMLYEVAWTRLLALALGSSTHAFSLMLVTFITGIAVGAWIIYRWRTLRRIFNAFGWAELALAATLALSMFLYQYLPFWFGRLSSLLVRSAEAYPIYELLQALLCFGVMLVPAICLGMTLPLVSRIATLEVARTGSSVGKVFAVNTLGTVLGAAVTGTWLLPWLGLARSFALGVALNGVIGFAVLTRHLRWARAMRLPLALALAVLGVGFSGYAFDRAWRCAFAQGLFRQKTPPATLAEFRAQVRATDLAYHCDGAGATVAVLRALVQGKEELYLKVNGKTDASSSDDMVTQMLVAHVPLLLHPAPREVLVVGVGSGATCGAALRHPSLQRLDAVEISPEVVAAARRFRDYNDQALDNPRLNVIVEDAKTYLQVTPRVYDVIISEPSNPWMAGVAGVFTREFYESCRDRLRPDGLMVQWVQVYETSDAAFDIVLTTFASVFRHFSIWQGTVGDLVLVGSRQPLEVDLAALGRRFEQPAVKSSLLRVNIDSLPVLLGHETISAKNAPYVAPLEASVHSDLFPTLEYVAQRAFFLRRETERWRLLDENFSARPTTLLQQYLDRHPLGKDDFESFRHFHFNNRFLRVPLVRSFLHRWRHDDPENLEPVRLLAQVAEVPSPAQLESARLAPLEDRLRQQAATDPRLLRHLAISLMADYRELRSIYYRPDTLLLKQALDRLLVTDTPNSRSYQLLLAELAWDRGDDLEALRLGRVAFNPEDPAARKLGLDLDPKAPRQVLARLIEACLHRGTLEDAWALCQSSAQKGFVTRTGESADPYLALVYRKVLAAVAERAPAPAPPTPPATN